MASRKPILNFLPTFLSVVIFVAILLVLLSGINNALSDLYYLKTNIAGLKLASPLAGSEFLRDISTVSGTDLVGDDVTASSLGLADSYTISLLTFCARFASGPVCSRPRLGFWFDPGLELRLDATSLHASYTPEYRDALSGYNRTAPFVAGALVLCALAVGLSAIFGLVGVCVGFGGTLAAVLSVIATIFLLAANAAAVYVFVRLNNAFNGNFATDGLSSSLGAAPLALGWVAFVLSLLVSAMLVLRLRGDGTTRGRRALPGFRGGPKAGGALITGVGAPNDEAGIVGAEKKRGVAPGGLLQRVTTWNRHKYVQVEKQPALGSSHYPGQEQTALVEGGPGQRVLDEDWAADDQYSRARYGAGGAGDGVPLRPLASGGPRTNVSTAYEPYNHGS